MRIVRGVRDGFWASYNEYRESIGEEVDGNMVDIRVLHQTIRSDNSLNHGFGGG